MNYKKNMIFFTICGILLIIFSCTPLVTAVYSGTTKYTEFTNILISQNLYGWAVGADDGLAQINLYPYFYGLFFTITFFLPLTLFGFAIYNYILFKSESNSTKEPKENNRFPLGWIIVLPILIIAFLTYTVEVTNVKGYALGGLKILSYTYSFSMGTYLIVLLFVAMLLHFVVTYFVSLKKTNNVSVICDKKLTELMILKELLNENVITIDEYNKKKEDILKNK